MTKYITTGPVRGECGHAHRTLSGAVRCLREDRRGCQGHGGYSDRQVLHADWSDLDRDEFDTVHYLLDNPQQL